MSAFRVGQRVRLVQCISYPELSGMTAVVTSGLEPARVHRTGVRENLHRIAIDGMGALGPGGRPMAARPWQLEPILPEGAAPSTWAECVWQPEHLRASA